MSLGLVEIKAHRGHGYVVEYGSDGNIIAASGEVELNIRDWNEEDLGDWYMNADVEWMQDADLIELPIPYLPNI